MIPASEWNALTLREENKRLREALASARKALERFDGFWGIKLESESRSELQALTETFRHCRATLAALHPVEVKP